MNGHGKSDRPVVPGKPPNNAGLPVAEGAEGRGLAKGNSLQQTALRTQSRAGAPRPLERVRQAAQRDRQGRFTALLHHVYNVEILRAAYFALKREAAPGVEGHFRYYGVPMNYPALALFRFQVGRLWHRALERRSQTARVLWSWMASVIDTWLPAPRICHPYPLRRMGVVT